MLILRRIFQDLGPLFSVIIVSLVGVFFYSLVLLPESVSVESYAAAVILLHFNRTDRMFLRTVFDRREKQLFLLDYAMLSLPFLVLLLCRGSWLGIFCCLLLCVCVPLIPPIKLNLDENLRSLFARGSYGFERGFRFYGILYVAAWILTIIGIVVGNFRISLFAVVFFFFLIVPGFYAIPVRRVYMMNYRSISYLLTLTAKMIVRNVSVLLIPLLIVCLLARPNLEMAFVCTRIYLSALLLVYQASLVRYCLHGDLLLMSFSVLCLSVLAVISVMIPFVLLADTALTGILIIVAYYPLKQLINGSN